MKLGAAFLPLISATEIALRNRIVCRLLAVYGANWWDDHGFRDQIGDGRKSLAAAKRAIQKQGRTLDSGRITAELTFGFWQKMLLPKHEPILWAPLHPHFPDLSPGATLADLERACEKVRELRNRISHHEPIFKRNTSQDHANGLTLLAMLSREKAAWLRPHLEVMQLMRRKP